MSRNTTVVVVDDCLRELIQLVELVEQAGGNPVHFVESFEDGVEILRQSTPALLVTDFALGSGKTGNDLIEAAVEIHGKIHAILVSRGFEFSDIILQEADRPYLRAFNKANQAGIREAIREVLS